MGCASSVSNAIKENKSKIMAAAGSALGGNRLICYSSSIDQYKIAADGQKVEEEKQIGKDADWDPNGDASDIWYRTYHKGYVFTAHKDGSLWGVNLVDGSAVCYAEKGFESALFLVADPTDDYIYTLHTDQLWYFTVDHDNHSIKLESYDEGQEGGSEWANTTIVNAVMADKKIICTDSAGALYVFDTQEGTYIEVASDGYADTVAMAYHDKKLYSLSDEVYVESIDLSAGKINSSEALTEGENWTADGVADADYHKASGSLIVATSQDELWSVKLSDGTSTLLKEKGEGWDKISALLCC